MILAKKHFLLIVLFPVITFANNLLIKQGDTELTLDDIDGYAFRMSNEIRSGFFEDPVRIDKLLMSMLNRKHAFNYSIKNNIINLEDINSEVDKKVIDLFAFDNSVDDTMEKEATYKKIREYLFLEEAFAAFQKHILNSITTESLSELAYEEYLINNNKYGVPESRDLIYLTLPYNASSKDENLKIINEIKDKLKSSSGDVQAISDEYKSRFEELVISDPWMHYYSNRKNKIFSNFVFQGDKSGIIEDVLDIENTFTIVHLIKINEPTILPFDNVEEQIINNLKKNKATRKFNNIMADLTKESSDINKENVIKLLTRYQ
jgi:hypothetical protein